MCLSTPKTPTAAPLPPSVTNPTETIGKAETGARDTERKKKAAGLSKSGTLLTGGGDLGLAPGTKKTLLGQ